MENVSRKSRAGALIICLLLGAFGVHRMYLGKWGTGILMLVLALFSGPFIVFLGFWILIDLVFIAVGGFKDKDGLLLKNW